MPNESLSHFHPISLAALGGFCDAVSFVLFGMFTSHITGGTVLAAIHFAAHENQLFCSQVSAIAVFVFGTAWGSFFTRNTLPAALLIEALLFLLAFLLLKERGAQLSSDWSKLAAITLTSAAMGIQNGSLQKIKNIQVRTTFLTGLSTRWVTQEIHRSPDEAESRTLLGALIVFFFLGASVGAFCAFRIHERAFIVMTAVAIVISVISNYQAPKT